MKHESSIKWKDGMAFDATLESSTFPIDADPQFGGVGYGPKPKGLLLSALAGCTGMDVVAILKKKRMEWTSFDVEVSGQLTEEHPKYYNKIHVTYRFSGEALDRTKIEKAVMLSQDHYCGVTAMLEKSAEITYDIVTT